jgi:hypothetical protein
MLRPTRRRLAAGLLALAFAGTAAADARGELHAAFLKNMAATSYRATMTDLNTGKQLSTVEFQAPDRYRISVAGGPTSVIANGNMYLQVSGHAMTVPLPQGFLANYRSDAAWKQIENDTRILDGGPGMVGAEPAHKYHWVSSGQHSSAGDAWVGIASGRVIQVETANKAASKTGAVRLRYSDFDSSAIRIAPPK